MFYFILVVMGSLLCL